MFESVSPRLNQQLAFLIELDKLKTVIRRSQLVYADRRENSAEHSWHVAMLALMLAEYADEPVDVARVVKMLLVHDIVEIDADDTYVYDQVAAQSKADREQRAAERIFGLLPPDQGLELRQAWDEFEAGQTAESRFATSLDRLIPLLHNYLTEGQSWQHHGVVAGQVRALHQHTVNGSQTLAALTATIIDNAVAQGYLPAE